MYMIYSLQWMRSESGRYLRDHNRVSDIGEESFRCCALAIIVVRHRSHRACLSSVPYECLDYCSRSADDQMIVSITASLLTRQVGVLVKATMASA